MNTGSIIAIIIGSLLLLGVAFGFYIFGADTMKQIKEYTYPSSISGQTQSNITNPNRMIGGKRRYKKYKK
jgi:hypothetical protein